MQLLVISDTHGRYDVLKEVVLSHPDADMIVHCGDGQFDTERLLDAYPEYEERMVRVRGNCDYSREIPLMRLLPLPYGHKALVLHGHRMLGGDFQENLVRNAKENGADLVLFGHLHARIDRNVSGIHLFNPGSPVQPRDQFLPSYGLVDVYPDGYLTSHGEIRSHH